MNVKELVAKLTLEEKAGLCSGDDFWHTKAVERLGIPTMMVSDGPHGLRKQDLEGDHLGVNESIKAVCFPAGCAMAASFDRDLMESMGDALGNQCQAEHVGVILGPAANIKRSPLCGRNFEYLSEDPYVAGEMAASEIRGVQKHNVGTSLKHFLANNQEHRRMSSDSQMDERTAREIYMPAFENAVKKEKPWTIMCSYNRINGTYAAQNHRYLTEILRDEWGFDGFVVSDWGAVNDRVEDLKAGLDLEMPSSFGFNDATIVESVKNGTLDEAVLDKTVEKVLEIVYRSEENRELSAVFDRDKDHELAKELASQCMVLLKNENILPLSTADKTLFVGGFAKKPRYQGGGSSHINSHKVSSAMDSLNGENVVYAKGYTTKEEEGSKELIKEAVLLAKECKNVVFFGGLPDAYESEGFDRTHMQMPECQNRLIEELAAVNDNVVVVLHNGSPVEMPWLDKVKGVLEVYLGGQAVGAATVEVLYGKVNPSGHLAETFPVKLEDNPSYLYYLGEGDEVEYREGVFVGYRYYDKKKINVLFPFGHGLSYTTFEFTNLKLDKTNMKDTDLLKVSVDVTNTGDVFGREVVQLYMAPLHSEVIRPEQELKGFEKVSLNPGETKTVEFVMDKRSFAYFDMDQNDWVVESLDYEIRLGDSSRNIMATAKVHVENTTKPRRLVDINTTVGDIMKIEGVRELIAPMIEEYMKMNGDSDEDVMGEGTTAMMENMLRYLPIRGLMQFGNGKFSLEQVKKLVDQINSL